jgi:hypothetical protein
MARGWESKSVQEQQEEAAASSPHKGSPMTPEETMLFRQRHGLLLARTDVLRRLETARDARYRKMLEDALADLNGKLAKLSPIRAGGERETSGA